MFFSSGKLLLPPSSRAWPSPWVLCLGAREGFQGALGGVFWSLCVHTPWEWNCPGVRHPPDLPFLLQSSHHHQTSRGFNAHGGCETCRAQSHGTWQGRGGNPCGPAEEPQGAGEEGTVNTHAGTCGMR